MKKTLAIILALSLLFTMVIISVSVNAESTYYVMEDFNGTVDDGVYGKTATVEFVDVSSGNKAMRVSSTQSCGFSTLNSDSADVGYNWNGYSFKLTTTGAFTFTPYIYLGYTHGGPDTMMGLSGANFVLTDKNGNTTEVAPNGIALALTEAFDGTVFVPKAGLTDVWSKGAVIRNYSAYNITEVLIEIGNLGTGATATFDDFMFVVDSESGNNEDDFVSGSFATEFVPTDNELLYENFNDTVTAGRYNGGTASTKTKAYVIVADGGYEFMASNPYGNELAYDWAGYAFRLKTSGAVSITPDLDNFFSHGGNDRLFGLTQSDFILIDSTGKKSKVTPGSDGSLTLSDAFEGIVVVPKSGLTDAWGGAFQVTNYTAYSMAGMYLYVANIAGGMIALDDFYWFKDIDTFLANNVAPEVPYLNILTHPANIKADPGNAVSMTVEAEIENDGTAAYQWQKYVSGEWQDISGANDATLSFASLSKADAGKYRCVISGNTLTVTSDEASITLIPQIENGGLVIQDFATLTDITDVSGESPKDPIFLGQYNGFNDGTWHFNSLSRVANEDGTYSLKVTWNGVENWVNPSMVYVRFENRMPNDTKAIAVRLTVPGKVNELAQNASSAHFMNLWADTPAGTFSPYLNYVWKGRVLVTTAWEGFMENPVTVKKVDFATGEKTETVLKDLAEQGANLLFTESGFDGWVIVPIEYWTQHTEPLPDEDWLGDAKGVQYSEFLPEKINSICISMGNSEDGYSSVYHEIVAVKDIDAFIDSMQSDVTITKNPEDAVVEVGQTATFTVEATATGTLGYQWQKSIDEGKTWADIENATDASYTTDALTEDDHQTMYRCRVSSTVGELPASTEVATAFVGKHPDIVIDYDSDSTDGIAKSLFEANKGLNVDITINVQEYGATAYTWKINGMDITDPMDFDPVIVFEDLASIGLDEKAPDALYFTVQNGDKLPGKMELTLDTSWNFFEGNPLFFYNVKDGALTLESDEYVSGTAVTTVTMTAGGSWLLNNEAIEGAAADNGGNGSGNSENNAGSNGGDETTPDTGVDGWFILLAAILCAGSLLTVFTVKKKINN